MKFLSLFVWCALISCTGCIVAEQPQQPQQPPKMASKQAVYPSGTVFTKTDDGTCVPIAVGSQIVIKLQEDAHGKFMWGILKNNKSIFEVLTNETKLVNEPGKKGYQERTITMKATKPGKSNLEIVYFPAGTQDVAGDTYTEMYKLFVEIIDQ